MKKTVALIMALSVLFSVTFADAATVTETIFTNGSSAVRGIGSVDYVPELGIYVAAGGSAVYTSTDGYHWSRRAEVDKGTGSTSPLPVGGFAYGNSFGLLSVGGNYSYCRGLWCDQYLSTSSSATMVVPYSEYIDNVKPGGAEGYYRYLKIKSKVYYDNKTGKFYCFGVENTASGTWLDWGIYSADNYVERTQNIYGNAYPYAVKWTKVNLGDADPFAGVAVTDSLVPTSFQVDGNGRMIFTVETATVGYWSANYHGETVFVDLVNNKALNVQNRRIIGPSAGLDSNGNFIVFGASYGNYKDDITALCDSFDDFVTDGLEDATYKKIEINTTSSFAPYNNGGITGTDSTGSNTKMAVKPSKFVGISGGIMLIPDGVASIASGKENDLKVCTHNAEGKISNYSSAKYKTVINDSAKLTEVLGNGGTKRKVVDACAGPNGQVVLATTSGSGATTTSNITVIETNGIDFTATPVNNASKASVVTTASKDNSAVTAVNQSAITIVTNEVLALDTVLTATVKDGTDGNDIASPNMTYQAVSDGKGTVTGANTAGTYTVKVKAICTDDPSVYRLADISVTVVDPDISSSLTVNSYDYNTDYAVPMGISALKNGSNNFSFTSSGTSAEALGTAFLAIALYNGDNTLVGGACKTQNLSVGDSFSEFTGTLNVPADVEPNDLTLKIFAWKNYEGGVLQWQ